MNANERVTGVYLASSVTQATAGGAPDPELSGAMTLMSQVKSYLKGFVRRLRDANLAVRPRFAAAGSDAVVGYSVGVRGDNIVWYGGGRLSPDLTLPKLRALWGSDEQTQRRLTGS